VTRALDVFLRWLEANGARFARLSIEQRHAEERGAYAARDIAPGDVVLTVPRRCILTTRDARGSEIGRRIEAACGGAASDDTRMAAYLLHERRSGASFWRPFLDILPDAFPSNPLFFDARDLSLLDASFLVEATATRRRALLDDHARLVGAVPELGWIEARDFIWARVVITSRNFGLSIDGEKLRCLVPMADLFNHRPSPETSWGYDQDAGGFAMRAVSAVPAGALVHDSYGEKCNSRFLLNYGFTLDDNRDNHAAVRVRVPRDAPWRDFKQKILGTRTGDPSRTFKVPFVLQDDTAAELLRFLRIAAADGRELAEVCPAPGLISTARAPMSAACEERALHLLDAACEEALARFATTAEEDDALLAGAGLHRNARNAIVMRRGEKRVLRAYRGLARACIPLLRMPWPAAEHAAARLPLPDGIEGYLRDGVVCAVRDDPWGVLQRAGRDRRLLERTATWRPPPS
jgi:hypothetical protein